ncbi:variable surface protein Vir15-like [Plasmodium vivax]|uniref:Variable surface protein Vir15-like n=1 Tax=Plasmodium vivax (strain Salvador I) TaxID=126793 RepID=A5KDP6_PLAVS|nr:variable surface protein Vir15-like [Plasmodium vivax]EDL42523.1 variable surface protein Vir15-like [Plasmodium vivax]|eukprot:XP_001608547.1 variable surface protein Vir15-like [Plasmodium vivax Sal-1]
MCLFKISGCKYLYQWVTKDCLYKGKHPEHNLKFYKELLKQSCDDQEIEDKYKNEIESISDEIFKKYKNLDDLYSNIIKLHTPRRDVCADAKVFSDLYINQINGFISSVNNEFYDELELYRKEYESIMKNNDCQNVQKTLPSIYGNNTGTAIIIPFSIISLLTLSLFIMYKFTPLKSILRLQGRGSSKFRNEFDEEINAKVYESPNSRKVSKKGLYNIAYHSN